MVAEPSFLPPDITGIIANERRIEMAATVDEPTANALGWNDQTSLESFARGGGIIEQLAAERRQEMVNNARKHGQRLY
jgi:hypothetical protein